MGVRASAGVAHAVDQRQFEGWIEEVDTGRERRFQSTEELEFLAECFELARRDDRQPKKEDERNR